MTPALIGFLGQLAILYAQDWVMDWGYFHKLNLGGAALCGFILMFYPD